MIILLFYDGIKIMTLVVKLLVVACVFSSCMKKESQEVKESKQKIRQVAAMQEKKGYRMIASGLYQKEGKWHVYLDLQSDVLAPERQEALEILHFITENLSADLEKILPGHLLSISMGWKGSFNGDLIELSYQGGKIGEKRLLLS